MRGGGGGGGGEGEGGKFHCTLYNTYNIHVCEYA